MITRSYSRTWLQRRDAISGIRRTIKKTCLSCSFKEKCLRAKFRVFALSSRHHFRHRHRRRRCRRRRRRARIFSKDFSAKCLRRARLSVGFSREVNRARKFVLVLPCLVYALTCFVQRRPRAGRQETTLYDTHVPLSKSAGWTIINQPTNKLPSHGGGTEKTFDLWASILMKIMQSRWNEWRVAFRKR